MQNLVSNFNDKILVITPNDNYHYFFAYYDMRATGEFGINQRHLTHRVKFMDRLPTANDIAEIGYLEDGNFYKIAETTAWNFQQGAMLQYHPFKENVVYYNVCENGEFKTVTHNFITGEKSYTDMATACVSPDGKYGLSINFGRIYAFRAGYGYAGFIDKNADINAPDDDGIFLTDMLSGKSKLLLSYRELALKCGFNANEKILVNHITFNPSSNKYIALIRNFYTAKNPWTTTAIIGDLNGNYKILLPRTYFSHYRWISEDRLVAHCSVDLQTEHRNLYILNANDSSAEKCFSSENNSFYFNDIHCTLTPDGNYIVGDGYPDNDGYRHIFAHNLKTGKNGSFLKAKTIIPPVIDIRCDLHARYVFGGKYMSFDTVHNGKRQIAIFPVSEISI